ncbi:MULTISPECIES: phage recombination protein Bet [unclassified Vibrio]|uniref:phage recombination protein Bet n=1 Tax=unclassified Vibrio TaxID=2614977 RepID=UPI000B8E9B0A|nr:MULTISPECIES: phage recombination protein Bet [unclassified Vibrio]NAX44836.1 phage recombination protein Bet [Vibrio sp. V25_P4S6T154]OXX40909.1 phage recombination protein Bet [Vibrio sp. V17_P4S1T151]OXX59163.1 phage recombination protein Bet [Vibrio sp. V15_P4S5T153]OXX65403.1 phage recombination protein Bet [Vibrio sp. V20_P4S3T152]
MSNIAPFQERLPAVAQRGIDESTWSALTNSIFPGAREESIIMAVDYCTSRGLDILLKPVHLVPMSVKDAQTGKHDFRDVVMPGIGLYRIQADRSKTYAGADEPEFGPTITANLGGSDVSYPEWCKYTVHKLVGNNIVSFSAKEYWIENYATAGRDTLAPNAMWKKRPFAQLAKCAEAQALRKAWPDIGQAPTAEEMEGKEFVPNEKDITPQKSLPTQATYYSQADFDKNFDKWKAVIESGRNTPERIISMAESKGKMTDEMKAKIKQINKEQ